MAGFMDTLFGTANTAGSDARERQQGITSTYTGSVQSALQPYQDMAGQVDTTGLFGDYINKLNAMNTDKYKVGAQTLDTSNVLGDVSAYLDPSITYQQEAARKGIEASQAGSGGLFSGAAGQEIANKQGQIAATGWSDAYAKAQAQKANENALRIQQQGLNTGVGTYNLGLDTTQIGAQGQALDRALGNVGTISQGNIDLANTIFGADTGLSQQRMQGQYADKGIFGDIVKGGVDIFKTTHGAK